MRSKLSFDALLRSIHQCKSFYTIEYTLETNLTDDSLSAEQRAVLVSLQGLRTLDEIHLLTAEKLGLHEEAAAIKAFIEKKKTRPTRPSLDDLLI
jgi:hypothetical protein